MIEFHYNNDFKLSNELKFERWIRSILLHFKHQLGGITYIFCDDSYLLEINKKFLKHDYFTDIISFDYSHDNLISGDIFISTCRVFENSKEYNTTELDELLRVMSHGVLHFLGYKDKTPQDRIVMRKKEDEMIALFHVEQSS